MTDRETLEALARQADEYARQFRALAAQNEAEMKRALAAAEDAERRAASMRGFSNGG